MSSNTLFVPFIRFYLVGALDSLRFTLSDKSLNRQPLRIITAMSAR